MNSDQLTLLEQRLTAVEDERAVRNVLARYMTLCDQPCHDRAFPQLGDLFTDDAVWEGLGQLYTQTFGKQTGRAAIVAFLSNYLAPQSDHFNMNAHFLTSDFVRVTGDLALGQWTMLQASTTSDNRSELVGARLSIDFNKQGRQWRIAHFRTQRLFDAPWNPAAMPLPGPADTGDESEH